MDMITTVKEKVKIDRENLLEKAYQLMADGVVIRDPYRIDIRGELSCGHSVTIDINVIIEGNVILEDGVSIGANCILSNCQIGKGTQINPFSFIEGSIIGQKSIVGPYGRLRPNTRVSDDVQIGNFVEIKNSKIDSRCRINHLSFVGDSDLATDVTIGAGTITCNHNGFGINNTQINQGAYIGSGSILVAPLKIKAHATIGSGSTITEDAPAGKLTIARSRQVTIDNWKGPKSIK
jgi:bifunctional UDP-N-acetylglucosamine pyrophosphorylase/glucosamine-1-phosphate N-acetyltransferase